MAASQANVCSLALVSDEVPWMYSVIACFSLHTSSPSLHMNLGCDSNHECFGS
jgi:hypothetical protein